MKYFVTEKISKNMRKTPEGFLVCIGVPIARTGIQEYAPSEVPIEAKDGEAVQIQRDEKEVFRPETIASFEGKPFTLGHPDEMVDPENWGELAKGTIQNVRRGEGEYNTSLIADIMITDQEAIKEVEKGFREVSCGYEADYLETGIGTGKQINIVGNHLALVPEGRAGGDYAIKDHKGVETMSIKEKISKIFDSAKKDALKAAGETTDKGMEVISDEAPPWADALKTSMDKCADAINKMTSTMGQPTKQGDEDPGKEKKEETKDKDPMQVMSDEIKALKDEIAQLKATGDEEADDEEMDDEEMDDESEETDDEESEETDDENESMVGDSKARIEILAPGKKFKGKDAKSKALKAALETKDGKAVLDVLTGGKPINFKSVKTVDHYFKAASEVLKIKRQRNFADTKRSHKTHDGHMENEGDVPSIEDINKKNEKHYAEQQRSH